MERPTYRVSPKGRLLTTPATSGRTGKLRRTLQSQQAAIDGLVQRLAVMQPSQPTGSRAPVAAAPDKCKLDMSMSAFRSWKRSVLCWLHLNKWVGMEAIMHLRLWCEIDLQNALDAKFSTSQLFGLTVEEALDALEELVTSSSNQAVLWDVFFSSRQSPDECVKEYFNKCLQQAIDCKFKCPSCKNDLAEYILVRKILVGLHDPVLKRELYQSTVEELSYEELKLKCIAFEAAARDSMGGRGNVFGAAVEVTSDEEPPAAQVTAGVQHRKKVAYDIRQKPCGNCNKFHAPGRQACPARDTECFRCHLKGHLARCCKKGMKKPLTEEVKSSLSAVRVSSTRSSKLPRIDVALCAEGSDTWCRMLAVADTGAEVCVAGPQHLRLLGIGEEQLRKADVRLVDIVDMRVQVTGWAMCIIRLNSKCTRQRVYFAKSSSVVFLSLDVCRELCLVPEGFPYVTVSAVAAPTTSLEGDNQSVDHTAGRDALQPALPACP